ncbi:MAG: endopeptidase La [Acidobacteria bacterium]|nr:endopeptidase La [Acidobacteriota bacterium]
MKELEEEKKEYPLLPLRDAVVFPNTLVPFVVGRRKSISALEYALKNGKKIFLSAQRDARIDEPTPSDIFEVGTISRIVQSVQMANGNYKVLVEGVERARILSYKDTSDFLFVELETLYYPLSMTPELEKLMRKTALLFEQFIRLSQNINAETLISSIRADDPERLADMVAAQLPISTEAKQDLLETIEPYRRLSKVYSALKEEVDKLLIDKKIHEQVKKQMEKAQKEYYLTEKLKAIQRELGRTEEKGDEISLLRERIEKTPMSAEAKEKALLELKRLEAMPPMSAEATVSRNYLEWLLAVPWKAKSRENRDLSRAERILNEDHYGLEKVKERIIEYLAVRQLVKKPKGSILCFVGAPGVGKSSLARSIARATGRKFVRLSLGGVRDEAEIRGHRRTYIGAFPGQIIQMMRKAKTKNPVFLLDEVDKMSMDFRGDPSAALMEVLDPEQNNSFVDHYLDVEFDLSEVMFIATANTQEAIPRPLQDRMEIIHLSGYTLNEKIAIAKNFLFPKQIKAHGLSRRKVELSDEAITYIIERYTREAGVRNLERHIASICRKIAKKVVAGEKGPFVINSPEMVEEYLGKPKYRKNIAEKKDEVGLAQGLAWTEMGGEILPIECVVMRGKGKLNLTGQLGEVMQESARAALSYIRSRAEEFGIDPQFHEKYDLHIHIPEGAIPKDGPSAGITIATAMISALTRIPVRSTIAMSGEITLRGKVLPVGGVKEKLLAAHRSGILKVIFPKENEKDFSEIPEEVKRELRVHLVEEMDEVLRLALAKPLPSPAEVGRKYKPPLSSGERVSDQPIAQ